ncbi:MAG: hypothetical protein MI919_26510 [Holophagales bacterium]|nr:hypothetical protein [Holophagales bacterium]
MGADDRIGPKEEYQSLRQELLESKRYVFERPLLIAAAGIAALGAFKDVQAAPVPLVITGLLLFNLWFTVNRLRSSSRIVAYIHLQLEGQPLAPWCGWETSLRLYRKWLKREDAETIIQRELDRDAVPDGLMYYPALHRLHLGIALLALIGSGFVLVDSRSPVSIACSVGTFLLVFWFGIHAVRYRPGRMRALVERNCVIWGKVLQDMSADRDGGGSSPSDHREEAPGPRGVNRSRADSESPALPED